jgi:hypothetical protein
VGQACQGRDLVDASRHAVTRHHRLLIPPREPAQGVQVGNFSDTATQGVDRCHCLSPSHIGCAPNVGVSPAVSTLLAAALDQMLRTSVDAADDFVRFRRWS